MADERRIVTILFADVSRLDRARRIDGPGGHAGLLARYYAIVGK